MNFRTTLILFALLVAVGLTVFFVNRKGDDEGKTDAATKKLVDLTADDVTKVVVSPAGGTRMAFERPAEEKEKKDKSPFAPGREWKMLEPVAAGAQSWQVDALVRDVVALEGKSQLDGDKKGTVGLDQPQYTVELTGKAKDGATKTVQLAFGRKAAVGDNLYVQVAGRDKIDVVHSTTLYDTFDRPVTDYRDKKLVNLTPDQVQQVTVDRPGQPQMRLERADGKWKVVAPVELPGDPTAVGDIVSSITTLNATEFVTPKAGSAAGTPGFYGFANPQLTVSFTTQTATTRPAAAPAGPATGPTTLPTATVIRFGRAEDLMKKNVFVSVTAPGVTTGTLATVSATSLESFKKQPLDLRDRTVADLKADEVSEFTIAVDRPSTTQPTTRPAEHRTIRVARKQDSLQLGPSLPTPVPGAPTTPAGAPAASPGPTTVPATPDTQPAIPTTQPAAGPTTSPAAGPTTAPAGETGAKGEAGAVGTTGPAGPDTAPSAGPASQPATQPSATPAGPATQPAAGPAAPATQSTAVAVAAAPATQPATAPAAAKATTWVLVSEGDTPADEGQVTDFLKALAPFKASKYLETLPAWAAAAQPSTTQPATQPAGSAPTTYVVSIKTVAAGGAAKTVEFRVIDPGGTTSLPVVQYGDLIFEVERAFVRKLEGDFKTKRPDATPPPSFGGPGGIPGHGFPPGGPGDE